MKHLIGQSDADAVTSFEEFVRRKEDINAKSRSKTGAEMYCFMGAEDRWRWHGADPNGDSSDHSRPPCRCKYCKEQGLIRIAH